MTSRAEVLARAVVRWRAAAFAMFVLALVAGAWSATHLRFDSSYRIWFAPDDPLVLQYDRFLATFGNDTPVVVVFSDEGPDGILADRPLRTVQRLESELARLPGVEQVHALTNHQTVRGRAGALEIEPLVPHLPMTAEELAEARTAAANDTRVRSLLLSRDGKTTQVIAVLRPGMDSGTEAVHLQEQVAGLTSRLHVETGYTFYVAGDPIVEAAFLQYALRDSLFILPGFAALVVVWLVAVYRTTLGVLVPLFIANVSVVMTVGVAAALGFQMNMLTMVVPQIVFAYGISDGIHVYTNYGVRRSEGDGEEDAVVRTVRLTMLPCFLSSLTTAIGFGALGVSAIRPLRETGILCSIGVLLEYVVTFATFPTLIRLARKAPAPRSLGSSFWLRVGQLSERRPWWIIGVSLTLVVLGGLGMRRLEVNDDLMGQFKERTPMHQTLAHIATRITGAGDYEFMVDVRRPDGAVDPHLIAGVARFEARLRAAPELTHVVSIVDLLEETNRALHDEDPAWMRLPDTEAGIAELLFLLDMGRGQGYGLDKLISFDRSRLRISARLAHMDVRRSLAFIERTQAWAREDLAGADLSVTGKAVVFIFAQDKVLATFVESISLSIALVGLVILVAFRSLRLAAVSVLASMAPIVVTMGLMAVSGVYLDAGTAMVATIALGIVVDDTIHVFTRLRIHGGDPRQLPEIMRQIGAALAWSSLLLMAGFSVFVFSSFKSNAHAGLLLGVVLGLGLVFDLLLTPALLHVVLRLGRKPGEPTQGDAQ